MSTGSTPDVKKPLLTAEILEHEMVSYCRLVPQEHNVRKDKRQPRLGQYLLNYYDVSHLPVNSVHLHSKENNEDVYQILSMALFTYSVKGPSVAIPMASADVISIGSVVHAPVETKKDKGSSSILDIVAGTSNVVPIFGS